MAEYGVVLAVITIAVFGALALLSGNIVTAINRVAAYITLGPMAWLRRASSHEEPAPSTRRSSSHPATQIHK